MGGFSHRAVTIRAMTPPVVLVLASGRGERFRASGGQGSKLQAELAGKPVLEHTLAAVRASGLRWHLEDAGHPGMGDSIAAAVRVTRDAAGWLVLPGDLPLVRPDTLQRVAQALEPCFTAPTESALALSLITRTAGGAGDREAFEGARGKLTALLRTGCGQDAAARALLGISYGAASLGEWDLAESAAVEAREIAAERREGKMELAAEADQRRGHIRRLERLSGQLTLILTALAIVSVGFLVVTGRRLNRLAARDRAVKCARLARPYNPRTMRARPVSI